VSGWLEVFALLAAFAAAGGFLGVICGAMGVGGGAFAAMIVLQFLEAAGFDGPGALRVAVGSALATLAVMSAQAALAQGIDWRRLRGWGPWAALGAVLGGYAAAQAPEAGLRAGLGLAVLAAGLRLAFDDGRAMREPRMAVKAALAVALGAASGGAALGGGAFAAPLLRRLGAEARAASGLAAGLGAMICAAAALAVALGAASGGAALGGGAFAAPLLRRLGAEARAASGLAAGLGAVICAAAALAMLTAAPPSAPPFTLGAVNLPGALTAALTAGAAAPLGARIGREAPARAIGVVAAFLMCVTGLTLLRGAAGG